MPEEKEKRITGRNKTPLGEPTKTSSGTIDDQMQKRDVVTAIMEGGARSWYCESGSPASVSGIQGNVAWAGGINLHDLLPREWRGRITIKCCQPGSIKSRGHGKLKSERKVRRSAKVLAITSTSYVKIGADFYS